MNSADESCNAVKTAEPSMALVPYNANNDVLAVFNKPERVFHFVGKELKIPQDWNNLGVAAVVWDAVCRTQQLKLFCSGVKIYEHISHLFHVGRGVFFG
jgi:hypothetical protein